MKKSALILVGALCLSGAAMAQNPTTDSAGTKTPQDKTMQDKTTQQNYKKDMVTIKSTEVPASLKTTLQGSQYKGWETGAVYRNQNSDMYLIEVNQNGKAKTYRFDANGKVIE